MKINRILIIILIFSYILFLTSCDTVENGDSNEDINNPYGATVLTCSDFNDDIKLEDDPDKEVDYIIDCLVEANNIDVEIGDGTVVEFTEGSGLIISNNARIVLFALPGSVPPVILRGNKSEAGYWKGIHIKSDQSSNIIHGVEIHDAGSKSDPDFYGAINVASGGGVDIRSVKVNNSANYGVYYNTSLGLHNDLTSAEITNCASYPIHIGINHIGTLYSGSPWGSEYIISENNPDRVEVKNEEITKSIAIYDRGIPYEISGILTAGQIRIEDGVEIGFNKGSRLNVTQQITAWSESDNPIKLYGMDGTPGSWQGIFIDCENPSTSNRLENLNISYGGEQAIGSANISIKSGLILLNDCIIKESRTCGVRISVVDGRLNERGNTYINNAGGSLCEE